MSRQFRSDDTEKWNYGFGSGTVDVTISGNETASWNGANRFSAYGNISGTAGQTSFTKPAGWGHKGLCLLHQTTGVGAGNWELANVDFSGAQAVADKPLQNTYTTSGANVAQIVTLTNGFALGYRNLTLNAGLIVPAWNGSTGGILALLVSGTLTINNGGSLWADGGNGAETQTNGGGGGTGGGYRGGPVNRGSSPGYQGEGYPGGWAITTNGNGNGAGGSNDGGGAGGGNGTVGNLGTQWNGTPATPDNRGGTAGNAQLTNIVPGGGGGGGNGNASGDTAQGGGGAGGGIVIVIAKSLVINSGGYIVSRGGNGGTCTTGDPNARPVTAGGGGAGGSVLLKAQSLVLGTNQVLATGGAGGDDRSSWSRVGGSGGVGRVHVDYKNSYSGSTNPGLDVRQDSSLNAVTPPATGLLMLT